MVAMNAAHRQQLLVERRAAESKVRRLGIPVEFVIDFSEDEIPDGTSLCRMLEEAASLFLGKHILKKQSVEADPEMRGLFGDIRKTPHEFTKTFATYAEMDGDMQKIRHRYKLEGKGTRAYRQIEWIDRFVRTVARRYRMG